MKKFKYLILLIFYGCTLSCDYQGHGGVSNSIEESKKRKLFVDEYYLKSDSIYINDTIVIKVKSAWVENQWSYGSSSTEILPFKDLYQLVLLLETNSVMRSYGVTWGIGISGEHYIRSCGRDCLMSDFTELPKDVEQWDVQNGWQLDSASKKDIIGKFVIYKKSD